MKEREPGFTTGRIGPKDDKDLTNAEKIIFALLGLNKTICTAESMTAGGFAAALTRVAGCSKTYVGGVSCYTRDTKKLLLGLPDELLDTGLVTPAITLAMADSARKKFGTDYAVALTGNAGPSRDDDSAGVGRVYWAVVDSEGNEKVTHTDHFGGRDDVRSKAVTAGLRILRNFIEEIELV